MLSPRRPGQSSAHRRIVTARRGLLLLLVLSSLVGGAVGLAAAHAPRLLPATVMVRFVEVGPASGPVWGVSILATNGSVVNVTTSNQSIFRLALPPGSYSVRPIAANGWSPKSSTPIPLVVHRSPKTVRVPFVVAHGYSRLTFSEHGLTHRPTWTVRINWSAGGNASLAYNATESTDKATLTFAVEMNTTYFYDVSSVPGFVSSPITGYPTIWHPHVVIHVHFEPV
ncbi:MAG TPA: carboxypeptidase-like regulatory domain-containing protein [Thermoplasmata archaeon]|nr:carboxypeptidase-like regulatory domain-containing protein [Thermoplasmata archaeon]